MNNEYKNDIDKNKEEPWKRFQKHMPRSNDITLIILKGHLLVEQELNDILDIELRYSRALYDVKITFYHRLAIVKSIYGTPLSGGFPYDEIKKLNTLRNRLVHSLEPKDLEKHVELFLRMFENPDSASEFAKQTLGKRLKLCLAGLCGLIHGFEEGWKAGLEKR